MIADGYTPVRTVLLVFPFKNFFYFEISGVRGIIKMNDAKTPAADITIPCP